MSLRFKLFFSISMILCVVLGVVVLLTLQQERKRAEQVQTLDAAFINLATDLASPADLVQESILVRNDKLHPVLRSLGIYDRPLGGGPAEPVRTWGLLARDPDEAAAALRLVEEVYVTGQVKAHGRARAVPTRLAGDAARPGERVGKVVYLDVRSMDDAGSAPVGRIQFLLIVGGGVILLVTAWWMLERLVVRPLHEIAAAAARVALGDHSRAVPQTGSDDEMQRVVGAFNQMMVDLEALQGRLREQVGDALARARQTQDSLVVAQRLAATGRLAAGIAHEVNNPLAGLLNAVHALRTRDLPHAKREEYLELIQEGLQRIQQTVAKILQFRPHKVAPRAVTVDEIVRPVLGLARHRIDKIEAEVVLEGDGSAEVFGDPYELQQALLNVVLNALDALEDAKRETPRLVLRIDADERDVRLLVRDNGTGMKEEDLARAFDLFFTTKDPGKGTGLGLAMVHKIVTDHGGRIQLRSRGTEGVDVEISLPRFRVGA